MHSSRKPDSGTLKLLSPPKTVVPDVQPRVDRPHQSCPASWPSNVVPNAANISQIHNELTESASYRRATFANIGNKFKRTSVFRRPRVPGQEHVGASDDQKSSPREPRPANPDRLPTTTLAPVTISGHGDTGRLDVGIVSGSRDDQASSSVDHHRSVAKRLISSSGSIKRIFFSRGARKTHHQIAAVPSPMLSSVNAQRHPPDIRPPPMNVLDDRTPNEMGSDTASWLPGSEMLEGSNQKQAMLRLADPPRKRRPCARQDNSTPYNRPGPSARTFACPPSSNHPGVFASPLSPLPAQPAGDWVCTPGGSPPDVPETLLWFGAPSESSHPSGTDNGMTPPDEHGPKNPSAELTGLPYNPDRTVTSAESPSWHKTVAQQRYLDRDSCRVRENEGLDHEAKQVAREPNPEEKGELLATPKGSGTSREHYIEISRSTPHREVDRIPKRVSDIMPHLITPPLTPVERADSSHPSHGYELSLAHLCGAGRSQGQGTPELLPSSSLSPEESATFDICNGAPALSRRKRLRNCQRAPSEKGKLPMVRYPVLDSSDEDVFANESEVDNCSEVFTDAYSGSYNGSGSPKSVSKRSFSTASMDSTGSSNYPELD